MDMNENSGEIVFQQSADLKHGEEGSFLITLLRNTPSNNRFGYAASDLVLLYLDPPEPDNEFYIQNFKKTTGIAMASDQNEARESLDVREEAVESTPDSSNRDSSGNPMRAPSPLQDNPKHALGIVESVSRDSITIRVLIRDSKLTAEELISGILDENQATDNSGEELLISRETLITKAEFGLNRQGYRLRALADAMTGGDGRWYLAKVMSLVTAYREYQALMSFPDLILKNHLLLNSKKNSDDDTLEIPEALTNTLEAMYNESQMAALRECMKPEGITCIQGPPGTGKTTTIVGILSVLLNAEVVNRRNSDNDRMLSGDLKKKRLAEAVLLHETKVKFARMAAPWTYNPTYLPWYDSIHIDLEDVETNAAAPPRHNVIDIVNNTKTVEPRKILVCAPSNAAIDEILRRITGDPRQGGGIFDGEGKRFNPQVLRMGPNSHPDLKKWTLQERITSRLQASQAMSEDSIRHSLIEEAKVVCATLSVTGAKDLVTFGSGFDTVVVDEASQGVEMSTIIPLKLSCRRLVLVGDPRQLPATVFSKVALDMKYDQSLFQRLERANHQIKMLSVQYRMHPAISKFPSMMFYDGGLLDWEGVLQAAKPPIPYHDIPIFKPVVFFSLESEDTKENTSRVNREEVDFICQMIELLKCLFDCVPDYKNKWMDRIAVISPYAEQVKLCAKQIKALFGLKDTTQCPIDVNTVDGFQGREKDLVIFSAVRAQATASRPNKKTNVGFLADHRRMNVALTRARLNMWVVGNGSYLSGNPEWGKFWEYANQTNSTFNVSYERLSKSGYLKRWLLSYFKRQPVSRIDFQSNFHLGRQNCIH